MKTSDVARKTTNNTPRYQHLFTPHEFWEAIDRKIGKNSIYNLLRANKIRHICIGRKLLIPKSEIEAFLERELS